MYLSICLFLDGFFYMYHISSTTSPLIVHSYATPELTALVVIRSLFRVSLLLHMTCIPL